MARAEESAVYLVLNARLTDGEELIGEAESEHDRESTYKGNGHGG